MTILNPDNSPDVDAFIFHLEMLGFARDKITLSSGGHAIFFVHKTKHAALHLSYHLKDYVGSTTGPIRMAMYATNMQYYGCGFHIHEFLKVKRSDVDALIDSYRVRKETEKQLRKEMKARMEEFNLRHCDLIRVMQPNAK